jgi:hypothetical protein
VKTTSRIILSAFVLILFISCKKVLEHPIDRAEAGQKDGFTEYIIEEEEHYATANGYKPITNRKGMHFMAWLDSSCIYMSANAANQADINKLYGFGDCNAGHQQSSARVGWNWNGKAFDLYAYCYVNSIRQSTLLGSVKPMEVADLSISINENKYLFKFNGKLQTMERGCSTDEIVGYQLYPYFGGDEAAPHLMKIYIKEVE